LGDYDEAKRLFAEANAIFKQLGNKRGIAFTLNNLGNIASRLSQYDEAVRYFEESLALYRDTGDRSGIANALQNIGYVEWMMHDYPKAKGYFEESYAIRKAIGDKKGMADSLINLANTFESETDYEHALNYYQESLAISREIGYKAGIASSLQHLGYGSWITGDYSQGKTIFTEAVAVQREIGDPFELALTLGGLAQTLNWLGDSQGAIPYAEEALQLYGNRNIVWKYFTYLTLGQAHLELGELEKARTHLTQAITHLDELPRDATLSILLVSAALIAAEGDDETAVEIVAFCQQLPEYMQQAPVIRQRVDTELARVRARLSEGTFAAAQARGKAHTMESITALAREMLKS
jgi:tetratricopeptide (TPR) repeat protein